MDGAAISGRAHLALALLAVDPAGIGGLWLRARAGAWRDRFMSALAALPLPAPPRRLPPGIDEAGLTGGLDLAATLAQGRPVMRQGLLAAKGVLLVPMAERCAPALAARLAQALDGGRHALILLDEGAAPDEAPSAALTGRLGLFLCEEDLAPDGTAALPAATIDEARHRLATLRCDPVRYRVLAEAAAQMGIACGRTTILALRVARAHAALAGRAEVAEADLAAAATLALAHLALPAAAPAPPASPPPPEPEPPDTDASSTPGSEPDHPPPADIVVAAAQAALPPGLLDTLVFVRQAGGAGAGRGGPGRAGFGNRRGPPLPSRRGAPSDRQRLDLVATLRNAAPWQGLRQPDRPVSKGKGARAPRLCLRRDDLAVRRVKVVSDRLLIFAVDASGSAAAGRLAEAKGAVERLLASAYARRDHVALLTFRGTGAVLDLPPSRSLVQVKNRLRGLPGGGGTPLAGALHLAAETARRAQSRGMAPAIALLTDGRGNVALDGSPGRAQAAVDAARMARHLRALGLPALVIDTAPRAQPALAELAATMGGRYVALPRASAESLATALAAAMG